MRGVMLGDARGDFRSSAGATAKAGAHLACRAQARKPWNTDATGSREARNEKYPRVSILLDMIRERRARVWKILSKMPA
jgi:hypothetical protein